MLFKFKSALYLNIVYNLRIYTSLNELFHPLFHFVIELSLCEESCKSCYRQALAI